MLNKIITYSIKNKLIIGLFIISLIGWGAFELTRLPIDAVPDITNNQVQVITIAPSFGATDIERLVTFPIEQANNNISGLKEIRSFSRFGLSLVTIVFDDATDIYWARQQVAERLQKVQSQIPQGIGVPELGPVSTGIGEKDHIRLKEILTQFPSVEFICIDVANGYSEAFGDYVKVVTDDSSNLVLSTMKSFETTLNREKFVRVHKSYIINIDKIERFNSKFAEIGNSKIPLSRNKKEDLAKALALQ